MPRYRLRFIFSDNSNWERYIESEYYKVREVEMKEVNKMLGCGDSKNGYMVYRCPECSEYKTIAFRCKSRLCTSCGKRYADEWAIKLSLDLFDVRHRHMVFTIPELLRGKFEGDRNLFKVIMDSVNQTMKQLISQRRREMKITPGVICVLHPYGKDMKFNPHVHVLVTEGGLNGKNQWVDVNYFPYNKLRRIWQYHLLTNLKASIPNSYENSRLIDNLFKNYKDGFYIYAKNTIDKPKDICQYVGRYVRHPAIAESRILDYDGESVTFYYENENKSRVTIKLPVFEFIHRIVQHVPEPNFKMIRYYGLYARNKKKITKQLMIQLGKYDIAKANKLEQRLKKVWEIICENCNIPMEHTENRFPT